MFNSLRAFRILSRFTAGIMLILGSRTTAFAEDRIPPDGNGLKWSTLKLQGKTISGPDGKAVFVPEIHHPDPTKPAHQPRRTGASIAPGALVSSIIVLALVAATAGCCTPSTPPISTIPTVEMRTEPFGHSPKAEVYPLQYHRAHGDGQMVHRVNSTEVMYVVPRALVAVSDIAMVDVVPATDPALRRVSVTLAPGARARVQALAASSSPTHIVVLVWQDEIHDDYPAQWFDSAGPIIIGDLLEPAVADALAAALRP